MAKVIMEIAIDEHEITALRRITGATSRTRTFAADTQKVVNDALCFYTAAIAESMEGGVLGTRTTVDGKAIFTPLQSRTGLLD